MPVASITIRKPDDWHVHLRDGAMLEAVAASTAKTFGRAIVMPNLSPPVTTAAAAEAYRQRILQALPPEQGFTPLITAYLTDASDPADAQIITDAKNARFIVTARTNHIAEIESIIAQLRSGDAAFQPRDTRVIEVDDPVNYRWDEAKGAVALRDEP
jgi:dihydroorotase